MNTVFFKRFLCGVFFIAFAVSVYAQTELENVRITTATIDPIPKQKSEFPQWALDLRRFDIILFGSFPFTYWFASTAMDTYRSSQHNWDTRYAPWPVKSAGAVNMTNDEYGITLACAAAGSMLMALADHLIVRSKRNKAAREAAKIPPGEAIIIRSPRPLEAAGPPEAGSSGENGAETPANGNSINGGAAGDSNTARRP
jgi:hypothetical protein